MQHLSVARIAEALAVSWNTANSAVLAEGRRLLIQDPTRFDAVKVIGVDEHVWRHTRRGDKYVTVIIDLTGICDGTGPSRLLDMVEGSSCGFSPDRGWPYACPWDKRDLSMSHTPAAPRKSAQLLLTAAMCARFPPGKRTFPPLFPARFPFRTPNHEQESCLDARTRWGTATYIRP